MTIRASVTDSIDGSHQFFAIDSTTICIESEPSSDISLPRLDFVRMRLPVIEDRMLVQVSSPAPEIRIEGEAFESSLLFGDTVRSSVGPRPPVVRPGQTLTVGPYRIRFDWRAEDGLPIKVCKVFLAVGSAPPRYLMFSTSGTTSLVSYVMAAARETGWEVVGIFSAPFDEPAFLLAQDRANPARVIVHHRYKLRWSTDAGETFQWPGEEASDNIGVDRFGRRKFWFAHFASATELELYVWDSGNDNIFEVFEEGRRRGLPRDPTWEDLIMRAGWVEVWRVGSAGAMYLRRVDPDTPAMHAARELQRECREPMPEEPAIEGPSAVIRVPGADGTVATVSLRALALEAIDRMGASF